MIDNMAKSLFDGFCEDAFNKLGIAPDEVTQADPIAFWGYVFQIPSRLGDKQNNIANWVCGKDGVSRSSEVGMTAIFFGESSFYIVERTASLINNATKDTTEEYFYKDVVSVEMDSVNSSKRGSLFFKKHSRYETFTLTNMGGKQRHCPVKDAQEAETIVSTFRSLLRLKKS